MKRPVSTTLMETNYQLIKHNPIPPVPYALMGSAKGLIILSLTLHLSFAPNMRTYFHAFEEYADSTTHLLILLALFMVQMLAIGLYVAALLYTFWRLKNNIENEPPQQFYSAVVAVLLFHKTILQLPNKIFAAIAIVNYYFFDEQDKSASCSVGICMILCELLLATIFYHYMQHIFPLLHVPWAQPEQRGFLLNEIVYYLSAIALSVPYTSEFLKFGYLIIACLTLILTSFVVMYYARTQIIVNVFNQCAFASSLIVLTLKAFGPAREEMKYIWVQVMLLISLFALKLLYYHIKINATLSRSNLPAEDLTYWLWGMAQHFQLSKYSSEGKIYFFESRDDVRQLIIFAQALLKLHIRYCLKGDDEGDRVCRCRQMKPLDLRTYYQSEGTYQEMLATLKQTIFSLVELRFDEFKESKLEGDGTIVKNVPLLIIRQYFQLVYTQKILLVLYEANMEHNCDSCGYSVCFQNYILRKQILKSYQQRILTKQGLQLQNEFYQYLVYEKSFRKLNSITEEIVEGSYHYWLSLKKGFADLEAAEDFGGRLLKNYEEFLRVKKQVNKFCGDIFYLEQLSWRLHQDILHFETESDLCYEKMRSVMIRMKLYEKNNNKNLEKLFDYSNSILIISADFQTFQQIKVASKKVQQLTGFDEEILLKSKLPIILPEKLAEAHQYYLLQYLKQSYERQIEPVTLQDQWIRTKRNTIKNVNVYVSFVITTTEKYDIDFLAVITENKNKEVFGEVFPSTYVYSFLADSTKRILHFSDNFAKAYKLSDNVLANQYQVDQIVRGLPQDLNDIQFNEVMKLDLLDLQRENEFTESNTEHFTVLTVRMHYKEFSVRGVKFLLFEFLILGEDVSRLGSQVNSYALALRDDNVSVVKGRSQPGGGMVSCTMAPDSPGRSYQQELFQMLSQSSDSRSSTMSTKFTKATEIKKADSISSTSLFIKKMRMLLTFSFLFCLLLQLAFLWVSQHVQNENVFNLLSLESERQLKVAFSFLELGSLATLQFSNAPNSSSSRSSSFLSSLSEMSSFFQSAVSNFSQQQADWGSELSAAVKEEHILLQSMTNAGNWMGQNMTFHNAVNLLLQNGQVLSAQEEEGFLLGWDFLQVYEIEDYAREVVETESNSERDVIRNALFILMNGRSLLYDQLIKVDDICLQVTIEKANSGYGQVRIVCICSMVGCFLFGFAYVKLLGGIQNQYLEVLKVNMGLDESEIDEILEQQEQFDEYLEQNFHYKKKKKLKKRKATDHEMSNQSHFFSTNQQFMNETEIQLQLKNRQNPNPFLIRENDLQLHLKNIPSAEPPPQPLAEVNSMNEPQTDHPSEANLESHIQEMIRSSNQYLLQSRRKRSVLVAVAFVTSLCFSGWYLGVTLLQYRLINTFKQGFQQMDVFFLNTPCLYLTPFFYLTSLMFNESLYSTESDLSQRFSSLNALCEDNEDSYRSIQQELSSGMFTDLYSVLEELNSPDHCNYTLTKNYSTFEECETIQDGLMNLGLYQATKVIRSSTLLKAQSLSASNPLTTAQRRSMFFDETMLNYLVLSYFHLGPVERALDDAVISQLRDEMQHGNRLLIVIIAAFIALVTGVEVVAQVCVVKSLERKIQAMKMLLKIIPEETMLKKKQIFRNLDINNLYRGS